MNDFGLSDAELFPLLDATGDANLRRLREHPHAPRYNWRTGERLTGTGLENVRAFARELRSSPACWRVGEVPDWVPPFVQRCRREVPFYRNRASWGDDFAALPVTRREDVRREPWSFVPDALPVDGSLIVYTTSGTTGTRLIIPATAELPNLYLPLIEHALAAVGVTLEGGGRVSIVQVCAQRGTVVLHSVSSYLGGAGFAKVNLDGADWNDPDDAVRFLDECAPELITGDPFALWRLMRLPVRSRPKGIISAGAALSPGLRGSLGAHFGCPVADLYSMNESGPVGYSTSDGVHELFPHRLYVEVAGESGRPVTEGERGQILLTGGLNPYLPLVRYATGDYAAMRSTGGGRPVIAGLQARPPVVFRSAAGEWFNGVDVSTATAALPLAWLSVHQNADGSVAARAAGDGSLVGILAERLRVLFGADARVAVEVCQDLEAAGGKRVSYSSDLSPPGFERCGTRAGVGAAGRP